MTLDPPEIAELVAFVRIVLVTVLEGVVGAMSTLAVVYPEREYLPAAVRAFVDHAVRWSEGDRKIPRPPDRNRLPLPSFAPVAVAR